jgi:hypothetical protein|tara:strand:- start:462 stop:599 length:138 start_codon:yes stop_codon:yes gene_type:complete
MMEQYTTQYVSHIVSSAVSSLSIALKDLYLRKNVARNGRDACQDE